MDIKEFRVLREKSEIDLTINKNNVLEKSLEIPRLQSFYINKFTVEYHNYKNLLAKKEMIYGTLFHYYKHEYEFSLDKKSEIEPYINKDEKYYKICKQVNDQEMICKFLEKILDTLKSLSFNIKNFIDYNKFLNGE